MTGTLFLRNQTEDFETSQAFLDGFTIESAGFCHGFKFGKAVSAPGDVGQHPEFRRVQSSLIKLRIDVNWKLRFDRRLPLRCRFHDLEYVDCVSTGLVASISSLDAATSL